MTSKKTIVNIITFLVASAFLIYLGAANLLFQQAADQKLYAEFTDASGVSPRNDVTIRGVTVGTVEEVGLTDEGLARVKMGLDPGVDVPTGSTALIVRRSPIGELTIELEPGEGAPLEDGATIAVDETRPPPDVSHTIEVLADVLHAVPSDELNTLVTEAAIAVKGRASDLARLSEAGADLPQRLLEVRDDLEHLIRTSPQLTGVFADEAEVLADDITQTALLADILRDRRFDLVELSRNGASFLDLAGGLIADEKPNLACLIKDFGDVNAVVARTKNLKNLAATLDTNHFFFDAVEQSVQTGLDEAAWFRVQLMPHQEPAGQTYAPHRAYPDIFLGDSCKSRYGDGVRATVRKPLHVPDSSVFLGR